jgi:broad specificity phosphatase PhoE
MLHLVRHGAPAVRPDRPASEWELDPAGFDDVVALRDSGRLPAGAAWCSSPEPKALATAQLLHDGTIGVLPELREHERGVTPWLDDVAAWRALVRHVFAEPGRSARPGWEPLARTRDRLLPAVRRLLDVHGEQDVVLVGHGTAWTLLVSELTGRPPDLARWEALGLPDVWTLRRVGGTWDHLHEDGPAEP